MKWFNETKETILETMLSLAFVSQNPYWHPEGNVLTHTLIVLGRLQRALMTPKTTLIRNEEKTALLLAGLFHDVGKLHTTEWTEEKGWTSYRHEHASVEFVKLYREFIESFGVDPGLVEWLVQNHMKFHVWSKMREFKRQELRSDPLRFELFNMLGEADDMYSFFDDAYTTPNEVARVVSRGTEIFHRILKKSF